MMSANSDVALVKVGKNNTLYILKCLSCYFLILIYFFTLLIPNITFAQSSSKKVALTEITSATTLSSFSKQSLFVPKRKASIGQWYAEIPNPSNRIILSAGHVDRVSGTTGYNDAPMIKFNGALHTTEAALTKAIVPFMVEVGLQRGFNVEQFSASADNFREATLELAHYEQLTNGIAFEIHTDAPSEGWHRAKGYDGHTGIIPPTNQTITAAEACIGKFMGKFKKGMRDLFAPKQGISLVELFPTNREITYAIHKAAKTNDYQHVERIALPYINLFFDALESCGIHG